MSRTAKAFAAAWALLIYAAYYWQALHSPLLPWNR